MNAARAPALRIGVVNLMPRAETYEHLLLTTLARTEIAIDVSWLRLSTPAYASSDRARMNCIYVPLAVALEGASLDGLIVSGAPVEDMPFEAVTYWRELSTLLSRARHTVPSTLGLCWGALALAQLLGIDKDTFETKLFGVYALDRVAPSHPLVRNLPPEFHCPQSRYSGLAPSAVQAAVDAGQVQVLAASAAAGAVILESADRRFVMHTGHPEYDAERLAFEYHRDASANLPGTRPPRDFDLANPTATWQEASSQFFRAWLESLRS